MPLKSMTGFGAAEGPMGAWRVKAEVKSVNHRHLNLQLKLSGALAALEGDVEWGKVEAGQSAGLVDDIVPAAELFRRLVRETEAARRRLASL